MADTGSFPIALQVPSTARRPTWAPSDSDATRNFAVAVISMFLVGAGCAAAGLQLESQRSGSLILLGGTLIGGAFALPAWLLLRQPRPPSRE
jgi:hypothetical protein